LVEGRRVAWCRTHDRHVPFGGGKAKPSAWSRIKRVVLRRDGWRCQLKLAGCVSRASEVDHEVPSFEGGTDELSNLRAACEPCHRVKSEEERLRGLASARREGRDGW
jgi:5-methylcytosine-specific restriction protein A